MLAAVARRSARPRTRCGRRCGRGTRPWAGAARPWPRSPRTTCTGPRGCSRRTATSAPGADRGQRRRHERVRRAQHGLARDAGEVRAPRARRRPSSRRATAGQLVPGLPGRLEALGHRRPRTSGSESSTSSISACRRARSRWSKPIANRAKSGALCRKRKRLSSSGAASGDARSRAQPRRPATRSPRSACQILSGRVCALASAVRQAGRYRVPRRCSSLRISRKRRDGALDASPGRCRSPHRAGESRRRRPTLARRPARRSARAS